MKWTYGIKNKILASAVLLGLCLLVLLNNYLNSIHTQNVKDSIATLYADRMIVEEYILKMTGHIYQIREVLHANSDPVSKADAVQALISQYKETYDSYSKTKLTVSEKATSLELKGHFTNLEQALMKSYNPSVYTEKALVALGKLSTIQLDESKLIMKDVESQYDSIKALSQFAFATIIIILLVLQIIVFSSGSLLQKIKSNDPRLN